MRYFWPIGGQGERWRSAPRAAGGALLGGFCSFPFNRSDLYRCGACQRLFLRYTEYGGYYVDHRVGKVDAALMV